MSWVTFANAVVVPKPFLYPDWFRASRGASGLSRCSVIWFSKIFSKTLETAGRTLMGRKSLGWIGLDVFGMGVMMAVFHCTGNAWESIMALNRCARTGRTKGHSSFTNDIGIPSEPVAFV